MWQSIKNWFSNLAKVFTPIPEKPVFTPPPEVPAVPGIKAKLSWEKNHPERQEWSLKVFNFFFRPQILETIAKATDITAIRPDYHSLSSEQKATVLSELISAMSYYESGWNPKSESVDVGTKGDKNTWSVGLMQMSQTDQKNYGFDMGYTYEDLKTPWPNLHLALKILVRQVERRGKIMIPKGEPGLYWAVLHPGGKYDQSAKIVAMVRSIKFTTTGEKAKAATVPTWFTFAKKFQGKKETDPEFSKYMVPQWRLFGMNLGTIAQSWAAWCGLSAAVALAGVGLDYQKNGALAKNWASFGQEIAWKTEGIPQGAIVQINHVKCGNSSSNHVSMANGDCTASDVTRKGSTIDLYGGNQNSTWKTSTYKTSEICAVRWPKESAKPGRVEKSVKCTSGSAGQESTR